MNRHEYAETQAQILLIARMTLHLPLDEFLAAISKADSLAPILDPSAWIDGHETMYKIRDLAKAVQQVQSQARRIARQDAP